MPAERSAAPETDLTETDVTFAELGVPAPLVDVLADRTGSSSPFPVQAATLPDALAGRDILGRAQTGSGKTLGFSLPLVSRLADGSTAPRRPRGLVLVPTRELATQVHEVLRPLARAMGLWVTTIYGGVSYGPQVTALRRRTDIVVATPGRLADLIDQGECDLSDVEITVIDEADQMADLGLPADRPAAARVDAGRRAADAVLRHPRRRHRRAGPPLPQRPGAALGGRELLPAPRSSTTCSPSTRPRTLEVLAALVGGDKRSLVFTRTKHGAERLARQLTEVGIPAAELHGNLRQGARARNLAAFSVRPRPGHGRHRHRRPRHPRRRHRPGHPRRPARRAQGLRAPLRPHRPGRRRRRRRHAADHAQARDVTAMMRKAGITPHPAVAADAESDVLTEIAAARAPGLGLAARSPSWCGRRTGWRGTTGTAAAGPGRAGRAVPGRATATRATTGSETASRVRPGRGHGGRPRDRASGPGRGRPGRARGPARAVRARRRPPVRARRPACPVRARQPACPVRA